MQRYNLTVVLHANVAVNATSVGAAKRAIVKSLTYAVQLVDLPDFVIQDAEVTGVYDIDWNEIDATDSACSQ